jgi:spore coat protein A, manganese oxidase
MDRRKFLGAGLLVGGLGSLRLPRFSDHLIIGPPENQPKASSPRLAPYVDPLPVPPVIKPKSGTTSEITLQPGITRAHRDLPPTKIWGYNGIWPGPTIEVTRNQPLFVRWHNALPGKHMFPVDHTIHGAGQDVPEVRTVTHLHGARVMPESDGYPEAWISPEGRTGSAYNPHPYHYPNEQEASTLWYHDHALGVTRLNIYAGLAGFYLIRDAAEEHLQLPSGKYEIPLMLQDRSFNADGSLFYPVANNGTHPVWVQQFFGEVNCVNGKAWPFLEVEPRKYRFRILNASNSRVYQLLLEPADPNGKALNRAGPAINLIGIDAGLLPAPVVVNPLTIAPGERCDIVIDFAGHSNENLVFINGGSAPFSFGGEIVPAEVILFKVNKSLSGEDTSRLPKTLVQRESLVARTSMRERVLTITESVRESDKYTIIGLLGEKRWSDPITENPKLDSTEVWAFVNTTEEAHPIHLHQVHFEVLNRQEFDTRVYRKTGEIVSQVKPEPPLEWERGARKDTIIAYPEYITRVVQKFSMPSNAGAYSGDEFRYVWHCHILEHEDNEMMRPYKIVA